MTQSYADIVQPKTVEFFEQFPDENSCRENVIRRLWQNGVLCPHCGYDEFHRARNGKLLRCKDHDRVCQFTFRVGTVLESSPIPIRKRLSTMYLFGIHFQEVPTTKRADKRLASGDTANRDDVAVYLETANQRAHDCFRDGPGTTKIHLEIATTRGRRLICRTLTDA